jgi:hypothetical protein
MLTEMNVPCDDDDAYGMKRFGARPKYVLRKLAFTLLPAGSASRDEFVSKTLKLPGVCTQQRNCLKSDLFKILTGICQHVPSLARIPTTFLHKNGSLSV